MYENHVGTLSSARTMWIQQDYHANTLALNQDYSQVVIAGRNIFRIYKIGEDSFSEKFNVRSSKYNLTHVDVSWNPNDENLIASAVTNGNVIIWSLSKGTRASQEMKFDDHKRMVNRVTFHPSEVKLLLSGSQDASCKLFDLRRKQAVMTFQGTERVRDVQFSPFQHSSFVAVTENGNVQIWDLRKPNHRVMNFTAHTGPVLACDWHPTIRDRLATAGRDRYIKVWRVDVGSRSSQVYSIPAVDPVAKVKWRPCRDNHLASVSLLMDSCINVWDVRGPFLPFASFQEHRDVPTGIAWRGDPHVLLSTSRDSTLYQHVMRDAVRPVETASPVALATSPSGRVVRACVAREEQELLPRVASREDFCSIPSEIRVFHSMALVNEAESVRYMAECYQFHGATVFDMCQRNARIASKVHRDNIALTWSTLGDLFERQFSDDESEIEAKPLILAEVPDVDKRLEDLEEEKPLTFVARGEASGGDSSDGPLSDDESDEPLVVDENEFLSSGEEETVIESMPPTSSMLFWGDSVTNILTDVLGPTIYDLPGSEKMQSDWKSQLTTSPFLSKPASTSGSTRVSFSQPVANPSSLQGYSVPYHLAEPFHIPTPPASPQPVDPRAVASELLTSHAEAGDCQTAATALLVLGSRVRRYISAEKQERWFTEYIELLRRLCLFQEATEILHRTGIPALQDSTQGSTTFRVHCAACSRSLRPESPVCDRQCGLVPLSSASKRQVHSSPSRERELSGSSVHEKKAQALYHSSSSCSISCVGSDFFPKRSCCIGKSAKLTNR
ncbi:unnamed protein product [Cyprideis torosa]|uniref:GATOR2 complex protein WDR24 n=1 Tax=Cyprideis torosa TaxID=163714 RepID=A0A7R8W6G8_9CRUS|nr:unnamed protein product [Cyprideis torosa]CAG0884068.1 unnamed protein product [Cyprideis torosa]